MADATISGDCPHGADAVWMTRAELAAARGMSMEAVNRLVRRRRWPREPGVDGRTRVLVPRQWSVSSGPAGSDSGASAGGDPARLQAVIAAQQQELAQLRAESESARAACHEAELARDRERQAREAAEQALEQARQQIEQAAQAAEASHQDKEARAAEERAEEVSREASSAQLRRLTHAMAERRALGLWARLRLAWRGD